MQEACVKMTNNFLIVSFFTINTPYEREVDILINSLDKFDLPFHVEGVSNKGSWLANCAFKPTFCKEMMLKNNIPIVWVDCDAEILKYPKLFHELCDYDIACHYFTRKSGKTELLSGTLYFNNTEASFDLLDRWEKSCGINPTRWDQRSLEDVVATSNYIKVFDLPQSYVNIFDDGRVSVEDTFILHRQASRRYKRLI